MSHFYNQKNKEEVMNMPETKKLNWFQKICAKINMWMTEQEDRIGPIVFFSPIILAFGLLAIITDVFPPIAPKFHFYIVITGGLVIIAIQVSILTIGRKCKKYLPEYQIKIEKENLKQIVSQAEDFKEKDSSTNTPFIKDSIKIARIELKETRGSIHQRLDNIRQISHRLKDFVDTVQAIIETEVDIKTTEEECEKLPQKRQELAKLEQKLEDRYS